MQKYKFDILSDILKVRLGTKYVWEDRVRQQLRLVHLLEEVYGINLNFRVASFYPNRVYFGMPLSLDEHNTDGSKELWQKVKSLLERNRWTVYSAYDHVKPLPRTENKRESLQHVGVTYAQVLLSELTIMDLNEPSHGVGRQLELSLFQPVIGFSKQPVSRMVIGRPGSLLLTYESDEELLNKLKDITKRKSYRVQPFYIRKCSKHAMKSVHRGKQCLHCLYGS